MKVSPGMMPLKVSPGTPSIGLGSRTPCQWIEVDSFSLFVTLIVTSSPSRRRRIGAGTEPFTAVAMRARPVTLNGRRHQLIQPVRARAAIVQSRNAFVLMALDPFAHRSRQMPTARASTFGICPLAVSSMIRSGPRGVIRAFLWTFIRFLYRKS